MRPKTTIVSRRMYSCKFCARSFVSKHGLVFHLKTSHQSYSKDNSVKSGLTNTGLRKTEGTPVLRKISGDGNKEKSKENGNKTEEITPKTSSQRTCFECPVCHKIFTALFSTNRHMKKWHASYLANNRSPKPIEPIEVEVCTNCGLKIMEGVHHKCGVEVKVENENTLAGLFLNYGGSAHICAACQLEFTNQLSFESHVKGVHCVGVETLFFHSYEIFKEWKDLMEAQTQIRFELVNKHSDTQPKQLYCCTHPLQMNKNRTDNKVFLCPSLIFVRNFPKGIQVHFYKEHHGHPASKYKLQETFKKYSITSLMKVANTYSEIMNFTSSDADLYMQFKTLMESIVLSAAKINVSRLKELIGKALEMTTVLTEYNEDDDTLEPTLLTSELSDKEFSLGNEITKAIESTRASERIKTKNVDTKSDKPAFNKSPVEMQTPKIVEIFSLETKKKLGNVGKSEESAKDVKSEAKPSVAASDKSSNNSTQISFVDTFKSFVTKNFANMSDTKRSNVARNRLSNKILVDKTKDMKKDTNKGSIKTTGKAIHNNDVVPVLPVSNINSSVNKSTSNESAHGNTVSPIFPVKTSTFYSKSSADFADKTKDKNGDDSESSIDTDAETENNDLSKISTDSGDFENVTFKINPNYNKTYQRRQVEKFKTKIGQFNPCSPRKSDSSVDSSPNSSMKRANNLNVSSVSPQKRVKFSENVSSMPFKTTQIPRRQKYHSPVNASTIKTEEYEVKEQENDCNILILKI